MALLGFFSKREKHRSPASSTSPPKSSNGSVAESTDDYVLPDLAVQPALTTSMYANPDASSSKFHLGFHRKKANTAADVTDANLLRPPQQLHTPSSRSETSVDEIRPPPAKAALFSAYDPVNALSTRSLPTERSGARTPAHLMGSVDLPPRRSTDGLNHTRLSADVPPVPKKPGGLFGWAHRERKKSKPSDAADSPAQLSLDVAADDSFNLKSFRHIRPESPSADSSLSSASPSTLAPLVPPVRPRLRSSSVASDSSQRISVAAFREMAARRSAAGSPNSSPVLLRPPSRVDSLEHPPLRAPASSFTRSPGAAVRSSSLAISSGSTSSESEEEASESEESDDSTAKRPRRQRTITQKSAGARASSELGHRIRMPETTPSRSAQSALGHADISSAGSQASLQKGDSSDGGYFRKRASVSTSAMLPNTAAKRASLRAIQKTVPPPVISERARQKARAHDSDSDDSSSTSSDDSDDAPLASFVRPPRPGSSASNTTSASRTRIPPKPLIDITKLTTPPLPPLPAPGDQPPPLNKDKINEKARTPEKVATPPEKERQSQVLDKVEKEMDKSRPTHPEKPSITDRLARIAQTTASKSVEKLADAKPLERRSLDSKSVSPSSSEDGSAQRGRLQHPTRSQTAPMASLDRPTSQSPSAAKPRTFSSTSPNPAAAYDLTDPTPIVPTPIRQRSPPPAFSVTSRPPSQLSLNSNPRLSMSHTTVRMVESSSTSSSPTSPISPWTPPVATTGHLHQQVVPPLGHFAATTPSGQSTRASSAQPSPREKAMQPSPRTTASSPSPSAASRPAMGPRQRSSTLIPNGGLPDTEGFTGGGLLASPAAIPQKARGSADRSSTTPLATRPARPRSSTMLPSMEVSSAPAPHKIREQESTTTSSSGGSGPAPPSSSSSASQAQAKAQAQAHRFPARARNPFDGPTPNGQQARHVPSPSSGVPPPKPFANPERGNSPASSTGDSSSGRTPLTPADGSDYGGYPDSKSVVSAMAGARKGQRQKPNVSFDDEVDKDRGRFATKTGDSDEERRKERRRSEAKAAIELGNVVNGRISVAAEDDDELGPLTNMGPRMSMVNPMMSFTPPSPIVNWQTAPTNPAMLAQQQQFMMPQNADPRFFAAHQHAMMVAKQAYQMAVAQQALAAANEEWERGSSTSALSGMGMGMPGMGQMGGMGGMGGMGMMPMGGMGQMLPGGYGMQWTNPGSMMFPSSTSMYAGSVMGSDMGSTAGWGTRSEYGGPTRSSAMYSGRPVQNLTSARSDYGGPTSSRPQRPRTKTSPSDAPLPPQHSSRSRAPPPPSSWKPSGGGHGRSS